MALYHTYRPQKFSDVTGQEHIVKTITNQIKQDKVAHAYLFSGPRGIGKTTTARLLAKALNCKNRKSDNEEPCNTCDSCKQISISRSIDVIEIDAASHTGVDNVRENIIENAQFQPTTSPYKIFIIDEVHMLSTSAFNALLKTLEEPPKYVVFILATTELHKLPDTIISRCQVYNFKKISFDALEKYLESIATQESIKVDKEVIERIINKSDGCARDAVSLLDQLMTSGEKQITAEVASLILPTSNIDEVLIFVGALISKDVSQMIQLIDKSVNDGVNLSQFMHDVIELCRLIMIQKVNPQFDASIDISDTAKKELFDTGKSINTGELVGLIDLLIQRKKEIKSAPLPQLPLEMAVIEWCGDKQMNSANNDNTNEVVHKKKEEESIPPPQVNVVEEKIEEKVIEKKIEEKKDEDVTPKKTITETVKNIVSKSEKVTLEDVQKNWEAYLGKIEEIHPSFVFIFRMTKVVSVENNTVELAVEYSFHRDKLMDTISKKNLEKILSETLGSKVYLSATVEKPSTEKKQDGELQELASAFGGKIVQ